MRILACTAWDEATDTCTAQAWVEQPSILPPLTDEERDSLVVEIGTLWAIAFTLRLIARFIWRG